jgi:ParB family chromosome partitioning protein
VDCIVEGRVLLRRSASEEGMESLRRSISQRGILVPLILAEEGKKYRLVCGRRRLLCARSLELATVPALVVKCGREWRRWAMAVENREREEINPYDEALWLRDVLGAAKVTQRELSAELGVDESYVSQRLSMLEWPEELRSAVASGDISFSVGRELALITDDGRRKSLLVVAVEGGCSARQAAAWRREWEASLLPPGLSLVEGIRGPGGADAGGSEHTCALCHSSIPEAQVRTLIVCDACSEAAGLPLSCLRGDTPLTTSPPQKRSRQ